MELDPYKTVAIHAQKTGWTYAVFLTHSLLESIELLENISFFVKLSFLVKKKNQK